MKYFSLLRVKEQGHRINLHATNVHSIQIGPIWGKGTLSRLLETQIYLSPKKPLKVICQAKIMVL
jgi:hypothetical protein